MKLKLRRKKVRYFWNGNKNGIPLKHINGTEGLILDADGQFWKPINPQFVATTPTVLDWAKNNGAKEYSFYELRKIFKHMPP